MHQESDQFSHDNDPSRANGALDTIKTNHDLTHIAGELIMNTETTIAEQVEKRLCTTPEISAELQQTFAEKSDTTTYLLGCGDDRQLTAESLAQLKLSGEAETDEFLRYFGGLAGVSRVAAVTIASQYPESFANFTGNFTDWMAFVKNRVESTYKVKLALHSAEANEQDAATFNADSENGLGCAYCAGAGAVTNICAHSAEHHELTLKESFELLGDNSRTDMITQGNDMVGNKFLGSDYATKGVTRQDYSDVNAPVQILAGSHAPVRKTCVVENFRIDKVSNPAAAHDIDQPFYNNDVAQVAEMLILSLREFKLDPEMLLAVMDQDIRATRAALASHDAEPDTTAADLEVRRYGDPRAAIAYLQSL